MADHSRTTPDRRSGDDSGYDDGHSDDDGRERREADRWQNLVGEIDSLSEMTRIANDFFTVLEGVKVLRDKHELAEAIQKNRVYGYYFHGISLPGVGMDVKNMLVSVDGARGVAETISHIKRKYGWYADLQDRDMEKLRDMMREIRALPPADKLRIKRRLEDYIENRVARKKTIREDAIRSVDEFNVAYARAMTMLPTQHAALLDECVAQIKTAKVCRDLLT